jgi:hypothetical protein
MTREDWEPLRRPYRENWHHELLAEALEALASGELVKLILVHDRGAVVDIDQGVLLRFRRVTLYNDGPSG